MKIRNNCAVSGLMIPLFMFLSPSITAAAPPLQDCHLFKYGDNLPIVAFQTLDAIRKQNKLRASTVGLEDMTERAYRNGYLKRIERCSEPVVELLGSIVNFVLILKAVNYKTCKALKSSSLLIRNSIGVMVVNAHTGKKGDCAINPATEYIPFVGRKVPGLNHVSLFTPSLRGKSEINCESLDFPKNAKEKRAVDEALSIIEEYGTWSAKKLNEFRSDVGEFRICHQKGTALNDFEYRIDLGRKQLESSNTETLVRVLLEEIAHASHSFRAWPNPAEYSKSDFKKINSAALLNMEAEGWVWSWIEADNISKRSRIRVPLMSITSKTPGCREPGGSRQHVEQLWNELKAALKGTERGPALSPRDAIQTVANRCVRYYYAARNKDGVHQTYEHYYTSMSEDIHGCSLDGTLVVRRGRPMCDETIR